MLVFLLIAFFISFQNTIQNKWIIILFKLGVLIVIIAGLNYSRIKTKERYDNGCDTFSRIGFIMLNNKDELEKLKISKKSKVIIGPELSVNGGLYSLHLKGWVINSKDEITSQNIEKLKSFGANYFILIDNDSEAQKVIQEKGLKIFQNQDLSVYQL